MVGYREKVKDVEIKLRKMQSQYDQMRESGEYSDQQLKQAFYEVTKQNNLYEYGKSILQDTEKMSLNKSILNKHYYIVIPYFSAEASGENLDKKEIEESAFSELYTRAQTAIRSLQASEVTSRILSSEEICELLYIAYNRDDSELLQFSKALDGQYDALYSTGKDVLEKKQEKLDAEIADQALELATESIVRADKYKQIEQLKREQRIKEKATELVEEYKEQMDEATYKGAKEEIKNAKIKPQKED